MGTFFGFFFLASICIWVGSIVFYSFVATRHVDAAFPPDQAFLAIAPMVQSYLTLSWVCATIALVSSFFLPPVQGLIVTTRIVLVAMMFGISLYLAFGLGPAVSRAQAAAASAGEEGVPKEALKALDDFNGTASQLNGAVLLLGLIVVFISAFAG